ncbi:MAG TPA: hypothetical protein VHA73_15345 [Acidimicrobiales bacterium]|jgi:hypothetical protein|nr:hypothetical protein [Acidimicrobiales bacterium]
MTDLYTALLAAPALRATVRTRIQLNERGEGVISAAIAVLIVAFLGALMWVGFKQIWGTTKTKTDQQITQIGN